MKAALALLQAGVLLFSQAVMAQPATKSTHAEIVLLPSLAFMPPHDAIDRLMADEPGVLHARALLQSAQAQARARNAGPHEFTLHGEYVTRATNLEGRLDEWTAGVSRGIRLPGKADADEKIGAFGIEASAVSVALCAIVAVVFLIHAQRHAQFLPPFWKRTHAI